MRPGQGQASPRRPAGSPSNRSICEHQCRTERPRGAGRRSRRRPSAAPSGGRAAPGGARWVAGWDRWWRGAICFISQRAVWCSPAPSARGARTRPRCAGRVAPSWRSAGSGRSAVAPRSAVVPCVRPTRPLRSLEPRRAMVVGGLDLLVAVAMQNFLDRPAGHAPGTLLSRQCSTRAWLATTFVQTARHDGTGPVREAPTPRAVCWRSEARRAVSASSRREHAQGVVEQAASAVWACLVHRARPGARRVDGPGSVRSTGASAERVVLDLQPDALRRRVVSRSSS